MPKFIEVENEVEFNFLPDEVIDDMFYKYLQDNPEDYNKAEYLEDYED